MYDYVKRNYSVNPVVGERVRHTELTKGNIGTIAKESPSQGHYVMVRFDDRSPDPRPCHPTALEYLGPMLNPIEPGAFVGDEFFGDPALSTVATHSWTGTQWIAASKAKDFGNG